jgi:RNA polymerase sigma-70 factor (ECF subfamily)
LDAFEVLYRAHAGRVFGLCLRMTADQQQAKELTQDVFVRAWEGLTAFRGDSAFGSWLHRIAVNVVLMGARADRRRLARVALAGDLEDDTVDGLAMTVDVEQSIDLERAIAALPPGARRVFVLHDVHGYRHEEIARITGNAEGTLRAQLHRARRLLMEALSR